MLLVLSPFPLLPSFSHAPGTLPTQHGTSPDVDATRQVLSVKNIEFSAYSDSVL